MSYCSNCGAKIKQQSAKFCRDCGASLESEEEPSLKSTPLDKKSDSTANKILEESSNPIKTEMKSNSYKEKGINPEPTEESANNKSSVYDLGIDFEDWVEAILKAQKYSTQRRVRLDGKKGKSEIDILAKRWIRGSEEKIAVECKNYEEKVPVIAIRDFLSKLEDLQIKNGLFAVYNGFSSEAYTWGQSGGLEMWDGVQVKDKYFEMKVGRMKQGEVAKFEYCLPITVDYDKAVKVDFDNGDKVEIIDAKMIWKPFYKISFKVDCIRIDPSKQKHTINDSGYLVCDAMRETKKVSKSTVTNVMKTLGLLDQTQEGKREDKEGEIFLKLLEQEPLQGFSQNQPVNYRIIKLNPIMTENDAKDRVIKSAIEQNTRVASYWRKNETFLDAKDFTVAPNHKDIRITKSQLIFIPKWEIEFKSKDYKYIRIISANDGTIIFDNLRFCADKHWLDGFVNAKDVAVCDICGKALCKDHILKCPICGSWRCESHGTQCADCKKRYCREHITIHCSECKSPICKTCTFICPICNESHCRTHTSKCSKCNKIVCVSCTRKEGSFLLKKTLCKNCK
jgi:hypothetical protein